MAEFKTKYIGDILVCEISGHFSTEEVKDSVTQLFSSLKPRDLLWDLTRATTSVINPEDVKRIAQRVKELSADRQGCRTAFVASEAGLFNLLCLYSLVATMDDSPVEQSVFRSTEEALAWIMQKRS